MRILFTRHSLTHEQIADIPNYMPDGFHVNATYLAIKNIDSMDEAEEIYHKLMEHIADIRKVGEHVDIYGVIPVPLRAMLLQHDITYYGGGAGWLIRTYEAFNVQRSVEGEKPTFEHKAWLLTGVYEREQ